MKAYPICLVGLEHQRAVVVGGGKVAARKIEALLIASAQVTVISPSIDPAVKDLIQEQPVIILPRAYQSGDLLGAAIVIAATDEAAINEQIWRDAIHAGCLVNVVDDPEHSNFILPAVIRRGEIAIAISTGGASPALAHLLKEKLETQLEPELGDLATLLAELRPFLRHHYPIEERTQVVQQLLDSDLLRILQNQGYEVAKQFALDQLEKSVPRSQSAL